MKQLITVLLAMALVLGLAACSTQEAASWEEQYQLGIRYLSEGNYEEAIIAFAAAIEIDPMRPEAYEGRGDAYRQLGNLEDAQADYQKAWELDKTDSDIAGKLADTLTEQGKAEDAVKVLEELIQQNPIDPGPYDKLADLLEQLGQLDKAIEILEKGVEQTGDQSLSDRLKDLQQGGFPPVPDDGIQREVVEVSDGDELTELSYSSGLENIEIHLGDGEYSVNSLFFMDAKNVSIIGTGNTRLVSSSGAETIITMFQCDNFLLYGLVMGHDLEPYMTCSTGVVELLSSDDIRIVGCDIYGCGLQGINADNSSFTAESSIIRDCSQHGALIYSSQGVFNNCTFSGNCYQATSNPVFRVSDSSSSVTLNSCTLQDNPAQDKYLLSSGASDWTENDTTESGNGWQ